MGRAEAFSTGGVYINFAGLEGDAEELGNALLGGTKSVLTPFGGITTPGGLFAEAARRQCGVRRRA